MKEQGHDWSLSWPGNFCLKCHAEDAMESALALDWCYYEEGKDSEHPFLKWKSPTHEELVIACNSICLADLTPEERELHQAKIKALDDEVKRIDGE